MSNSRRGAVVKGVEHISTNLKETYEWRGFESCWFYHSGVEFAKTSLLILNHWRCSSISCPLILQWLAGSVLCLMLCVL